jgi:hypothetical protein
MARHNILQHAPSLLTSVKLKKRVEPNPHCLLKPQVIQLDKAEEEPIPYPAFHNFISSHSEDPESSSNNSYRAPPSPSNHSCNKRRLRRLANVPNKIKL